jgi:hypothetical protein
MKYTEVLLATAGAFCSLLATSAQAQSQDSTFTAGIGAKGDIITGADWISRVSYDSKAEHYTVEFKTPFSHTPDCTASLAANAQERPTSQAHVADDSTSGVTVVTFYLERDEQIFWRMPFDLKCTVGA